jgi:hypothetical protein
MNIRHITTAALIATAGAALVTSAFAQTDERLPWGALKAGNKDGTITAWDGGLPVTTQPPGFKKDSGFWADPYAADKPLYSVTGKNVAEHADKLSEATKELLKRYPTFRVDVYPTRRPANYSQWVVDNTLKNAAGRCKTIEGGEALAGCFGGVPFPVPKTGHEAMWNLILAPKGSSVWTYGQGWYVDAAGNRVMTAEVNNRNNNEYYNKNQTVEKFYADGGFYFGNNNLYTAPARNTGEGNLQRKFINPVANPDKTWSYSPGQRRVRLSPDAGYDFPIATSGGANLYDEIYMFSGKMDRFDWKLVGTKEMLIPYNAYKYLQSKAEDLMQKGHPNPDLMRWELHRVTVVEATLKPGARHVAAQRRYYFDEDMPAAAMSDAWDASGKLSRGGMAPVAWAYDKQVIIAGGGFFFDLATGVYYNSSVTGSYKGMFIETDTVDVNSFYSPEGLARRTQR